MSDSEDEGGRHTGLRVVVEKRHAPPHTSSPFPNYYFFSYFLIPLEYFSACRIKTLEDTREEQTVLQIDSTPFYTVCIPFSYSGLLLSLPDPPSIYEAPDHELPVWLGLPLEDDELNVGGQASYLPFYESPTIKSKEDASLLLSSFSTSLVCSGC